MSARESSSEIDETAALWVMRLDDAALDMDAQADFEAWLHSDVRHVGAFARAQAVFVHLKRAKALGSDFDPASFAPHSKISDDADDDENVADEPTASTGVTRRWVLTGASAVAATGAILFFPIRRAEAQVYETKLGEVRRISLKDGSSVTLNTDSRVETLLDGAHPQIRLIRGEALFTVVSPVVIEAGKASLAVQSAILNICRLDASPIEVKVCAGEIEFARSRFSSRRLGANMQATFSSDGTVTEDKISPDALARELTWQEGMLSFEDTPLHVAADRFARYNQRHIEIADPAVGAETVTGRFAANNPEGFARAVAVGLNLRVESTTKGVMLAR